MKAAIMQPYWFPYIGYFQLIHAADIFVIYDDVNYIKQGWINRNRILLNRKDFLITLQLKGAGSYKKINEIETGTNHNTLIKTITYAYKGAPFFEKSMDCISQIMTFNEKNLAGFIYHSIQKICSYLDINTPLKLSSELKKNNLHRGQEKIIDICKMLNSDTYINAENGMKLYSKERFFRDNIRLCFLKSEAESYQQFDNEFIPNLSIIDIMMFNDPGKIKNMLGQYSLA